MTILSAQSIRRLSIWTEGESRGLQRSAPLLAPFAERQRYAGTSFGLSPSGYDLRLVLSEGAVEHWLAPGEFLLAATLERFVMPDGVLGIVHDKSSWARRGLSCFNTVIEPGWCGYLTLELVNHGQNSIRLMAGQGIAQVVFHRLDEPTQQPYEGKYQDQEFGPVGPRS